MHLIADFHIHSHYSRATSPQMNTASLTKWGQMKGIQVMGTGDFTHPKWLTEMREKLDEAEPGLFRLKQPYADEVRKEVPSSCRIETRFMLTVEVSSIYSRNGKVRKVHSIIGVPSFEVASKINQKLSGIGNLHADGRPILGLDAKELLKIAMDASTDCLFIPAHIWTPHFGVLGSNSGFESLEECFGEMVPFITALETGLSSDPAMSRRLKGLDRIALVSNSDAHSPVKLGREANRFDTELSYFALKDALKNNDSQKFLETIEFYPEEGKYHLDGHRVCKVPLTPEETRINNGLCPKCHRPVTVGVMNRVEELADRRVQETPTQIPFRSIVPLPEILAEVLGTSVQSKKVWQEYFQLLQNLGNEFAILLDVPLIEIEKASSKIISEAIERMRTGKIHITPGYDGEYGAITIFTPEERADLQSQASLF